MPGCLALGALAVASCGSRTGLFGTDGVDTSLDSAAFTDAPGVNDASLDQFVPCKPGMFTFQLATAQLMFVIDRSGSMNFSIDGQQPNPQTHMLPPGVLSRWQTLRDALFQTITPLDQELAMGAKFFPENNIDTNDPNADACRTDTGVGIAPARGNAGNIINVFDTTDPIGGTPTEEAIRLAAQYLQGTRGVARTMIVATDGEPNCNDMLDGTRCVCTAASNGSCVDDPNPQSGNTKAHLNCLDDTRTIGVIKDIFENDKIPVYIIGLGSADQPEFIQVLDDMAVAGGRPRTGSPKHYNVESAAELQTALQSIGDSIAKCTYLTPSAPTDPNSITVQVNGQNISRDPTHMNGWDWVDKAFGELEFFGDACTAASSGTAAASITGTVTCTNP